MNQIIQPNQPTTRKYQTPTFRSLFPAAQILKSRIPRHIAIKHVTKNLETQFNKRFIKNLSTHALTDQDLAIITRGLSFIPSSRNESTMTLQKYAYAFKRRINMQHYFHNNQFQKQNNKDHQFTTRSTWELPHKNYQSLLQYFEKINTEIQRNTRFKKLETNT